MNEEMVTMFVTVEADGKLSFWDEEQDGSVPVEFNYEVSDDVVVALSIESFG